MQLLFSRNWKTALLNCLGIICLIDSSLVAQTGVDLIEKAKEFRDSSQWDSAIHYFNLANLTFVEQQLWDQSFEARIQLNRARVEALQFDLAREDLTKLLVDARKQLPSSKLTEAHILDLMGYLANRTGDYNDGKEKLRKSLAIKFQLHLDEDELGRTYFDLGNSLREMGELDRAMEMYQNAWEIRKKTFGEHSPEAALVLNNMATIYRNKRDFDRALEMYLVCDSIINSAYGRDHEKRAAIINGIAIVYAQTGRFPQALNYFNQLLRIDLATLGSDHPYLAKTYGNLGILHELMGDFKTAQELHKRSLEIKLKSFEPDNPNLIADYKGLAIIMSQLGDIDQALLFERQVLHMEQKAFDASAPTIGTTYTMLGNALRIKGEYEEAWKMLELAEQIFAKNGPAFPELGPVYHSMASILQEQGQADQALSYAYKGLAINRQTGEVHPHVAGNHQLIGNIFLDLELFDSAQHHYQKALLINRKVFGEKHIEVASTYARIARAQASQKKYAEALESVGHAIAASTEDFNNSGIETNPSSHQTTIPSTLAAVLGEKGLILKEFAEETKNDDHLISAMEAFDAAIAMIDAAQFSYRAQGSVVTLREEFDPVYEHAIGVAYLLFNKTRDVKFLNKAFQFSEKNKAALLVSALNESRAQAFAKIPKALIDRENQLRRELSYFEQQQYELKVDKNADPDLVAELQQKIFSNKAIYDQLIEDFGENYPNYYQLRYDAKVVSPDELGFNLKDQRELLIEYFLGDEYLYIFVIDGHENAFYRLELNAGFNKSIDLLRTEIENKSGNPSSFSQVSGDLYQWLIQPFENRLTNQKITIIPDGKLGYIPFEILVKKGNKSINSFQLDYLLMQHPISYAYSATYLENRVKSKLKDGDVRYLAFSPNFNNRTEEGSANKPDLLAYQETVRGSLAELEGTGREVESLSKYFRGDHYQNVNAHESVFKRMAGKYDIIHLATHAIIDEVNPLNSRLLFTIDGDTLEDGDLHAWELFNMDLNASLAVLSACNTGFGKIQKGEGVLSLGRAFAYAGCPSRLMSLWPAQDASTADIMTNFYKSLSEGMSKDKALREAKIMYLKNAPDFNLHPFYWAGFVLQGDPSAIVRKSYLLPVILGFLGVSILILIFDRFLPHHPLTRRSPVKF